MTVRGDASAVGLVTDTLQAQGIEVREARSSYDIWAIYRAVLYGGDGEEGEAAWS